MIRLTRVWSASADCRCRSGAVEAEAEAVEAKQPERAYQRRLRAVPQALRGGAREGNQVYGASSCRCIASWPMGPCCRSPHGDTTPCWPCMVAIMRTGTTTQLVLSNLAMVPEALIRLWCPTMLKTALNMLQFILSELCGFNSSSLPK